jgi:proline racemase
MILSTVEMHTGGEPTRIIVEGWPPFEARTLLGKRREARDRFDHLRRGLMLEPRGHDGMYGALLVAPDHPEADLGVLFMHNEGYSTMCGHGIVAVTTIALERGLLMPGGDGTSIVYDSPAGAIRARARLSPGSAPGAARRAGADREDSGASRHRVESVAFMNVPSFVLHGGLAVKLGSRTVRTDVAFGGAFYAIVDSEAVGLPVDVAHLPELRRVGMEIKHAIEATRTIAHPLDSGLHSIYGTIFTGPPSDDRADLRNVTIFADAEVDRSPCGTGTAAVMAVIDEMGLLSEERPFVHESLIGTRFTGRVVSRTMVGEHPAIVPEIEGAAWITGEHTFLIDETDPLREGFRM